MVVILCLPYFLYLHVSSESDRGCDPNQCLLAVQMRYRVWICVCVESETHNLFSVLKETDMDCQ